MIEQLANAITFYAFYTVSGVGQTGITVTIDVYEAVTGTPIVSAGSASALAGGLYYYTLASGSVDNIGEYIAVFKTADATVDQKQLPAIWSVGRAGIENLDATIGTRSTLAAGAQMDLVDSLKHVTGSSGYDRTTDSLEAVGGTLALIPNNPLLTTDARLNNLDATISSRSTLTAAQVWANATRTLTSMGTVVADIWAYTSRTLTEYLTSGSVATNTVSTDITIYGYCTNIITVLNVLDSTDTWFTIKQNRGQLDSESIIQVSKLLGLIYLNGQTAIDAGLTGADASYVVTGGNAVITLSGALAAKLIDRTNLQGEVKTKTNTGVISIISQFDVDIENAITRTI